MNQLNISILIPTLNAGISWIETLKSISIQSCPFEKKLIVDSGSSDNTVELAKQYGFEVIKINKSEFNHGATRQLLADYDLNIDVHVFLTQDAILYSPESIRNLIDPFNDSQIGMTYGRQLPHRNATALETHARLFNYPPESEIRSLDDKERLGFKVFFCSNSFSAYRRSSLLEVGGFPSDSIMGEDAIVAAKMLMKGFKIAYVAEATVCHSHSYTIKTEFKRYFDTRVFHEQNKWLIGEYGKPTGEGIKFVRSELSYIFRNDIKSIFKSIASLGAKWLGYKAGRFYKSLSVKMLKQLSMHKYYWEKKI